MIRNAALFLGLSIFATLALFPGCGEEPTGPVTTKTDALSTVTARTYYISDSAYQTSPYNGYRYPVDGSVMARLFDNHDGSFGVSAAPTNGSSMPNCSYKLIRYNSYYGTYPYSTPAGAYIGWQDVWANAAGTCNCNGATYNLQPDTFRWYMSAANYGYMVSKFGDYANGQPVICGVRWDTLSGGIWPQ